MNFLAHFQLAWPDEGLVLGALEGDYYKGPLGSELPNGLARGVRLHRAIDAYTDNHAAVAELRRGFPSGLLRYAGNCQSRPELCFSKFRYCFKCYRFVQ